ncbi:MAG: SH3 domain-containing protein [Pseudomonadota bacterium]
MRALTHRLAWTLLWCGVTAAPALALDYRVVGDAAAILYDAPSAKSNKLYVVSQGYPLEVIVTVQGWVKVRDASGTLSWIDSRQLSDKRIVMIKVALAVVRQKPDDAAPVAFQAQQNVLLELIEVSGGWLQVRHRDGASGYVRAQQVWGA